MTGFLGITMGGGRAAPLLLLAAALGLGACAAPQPRSEAFQWPDPAPAGSGAGSTTAPTDPGDGDDDPLAPRDPQLYPGSGAFVAAPPAAPATDAPGEFTLNFHKADLKEVVAVILGDMLQVNYLLDPTVQGPVTLQTTHPVARGDLLPTLETLLRMHGFAAVADDRGGYRVVPLDKVLRGQLSPQLGGGNGPLPQGYSLRVVPLSYIGAAEMAEILQPLAPGTSIVRVDTLRNLLLLAGTGRELGHLLDTIEVFDVDWVKGMSVGFFPLEYARAADVETRLRAILGAQRGLLGGGGDAPKAPAATALQGLFRIAVVESANGLLVVTPQPDYLDTIERWVRRLDAIDQVGGGGDERELYVYRVKSGEAANLAALLNQLLGRPHQAVSPQRPLGIAPGEQAVSLGAAASPTGAATPARGAAPTAISQNLAQAHGDPMAADRGIAIVADETRNSLLITATGREYRQILKALKDLDIPPLQVMIEATIVEVALQGDLKYGLQWFFNTTHGRYRGEGGLDGTIDSATASGLGTLFPGFNFSVISGVDDVRAVFSALAEDSLVNVLSSPSVMVLDNGTARIQVGDQVPIATQQQQSTAENANVINSIQYRDTGVVLEVTPRVTPGGLVTMVVDQEVSDVSATQTSTLDSPTITTRKISSAVAVQDGQAVVLGGLIRDRTSTSDGGLPGLKDVPLAGWLFGQTSDSRVRTELVVILTPRVIANGDDAARVTRDFRARMQGLEGTF